MMNPLVFSVAKKDVVGFPIGSGRGIVKRKMYKRK
jgi:hypothetical protein